MVNLPNRTIEGMDWAKSVRRTGFPGPIADMGNRSAFISAYDRRMRNPSWVAEHITAESVLLNNGDRKHSVFTEDDASM